ncbi:MAG: ABC transporter permease, partial [Exilispira sp.]
MKSEDKFLINLAIKNLLLYKTRTILTFLILGVGIFTYIIVEGMLDGMTNQAVESIIQMQSSDIQIYPEGYSKEEQFSVLNLKNEDQIIKILNSKDYIIAYSPRITFTAMIEQYSGMMPIKVFGINPVEDAKILKLMDYIDQNTKNSFFKNYDAFYDTIPACIGKGLAKELNLKEKDSFIISFKTKDGMFNSLNLEVSSIYTTADSFLNSLTIIIPYDVAKNSLNIDSSTVILAKTKNLKKVKSYVKDLQKYLPDTTINSWMEEGREIIEISKTKGKFSGVFIVFILIIASIGIINTMIMSVHQKTKEIGTLKALGMSEKEVGKIFSYEGLLLGIFGSLFGIILALPLN